MGGGAGGTQGQRPKLLARHAALVAGNRWDGLGEGKETWEG